MSVELLTEQHLEFVSLTGGYTGLSESIHVKMPHCWKSHVEAFFFKESQLFQSDLSINNQHGINFSTLKSDILHL